MRKTHCGFTLLELMVVLVIIGILAALAVPTYQGQIKRAAFSEVINAVLPYKTAVSACIQQQGAVSANCDSSSNGIPADLAADAAGHLNTLTVANGIITATADDNGSPDLDAKTYILTPTYSSGIITWAATGTCAAAGLC